LPEAAAQLHLPQPLDIIIEFRKNTRGRLPAIGGRPFSILESHESLSHSCLQEANGLACRRASRQWSWGIGSASEPMRLCYVAFYAA